MTKGCAAVVLGLALSGCSNESVEKMSSGDVAAPWEALEKFQQGSQVAVAYPGQRGDWNAAKKAAASEEFAAGVAEFEQSPLPDGHSDKQAGKDAAVAALKELIEAGKSGTAKDVETKYQAASEALGKLHE